MLTRMGPTPVERDNDALHAGRCPGDADPSYSQGHMRLSRADSERLRICLVPTHGTPDCRWRLCGSERTPFIAGCDSAQTGAANLAQCADGSKLLGDFDAGDSGVVLLPWPGAFESLSSSTILRSAAVSNSTENSVSSPRSSFAVSKRSLAAVGIELRQRRSRAPRTDRHDACRSACSRGRGAGGNR